MENNPLYDNSLRHFLNFKLPNYGRVEITEPLNFDSFSFKIKQANDRYGRDKEIGADEIDLEFGNVYGQKTNVPQTLIDGTIVNELSHRLDLIFEAIKEKGSESEIEYILSQNNIDFVTGILDIPESTTDGYSNFKCSVIQSTNKALIERKKDIKADVFSTTDTFGKPQIPLAKSRILLKAKPVIEISKWGDKNINSPIIQNGVGFSYQISIPLANKLNNFGIKDSYAPFDVFVNELEFSQDDNRKFQYANAFITAVDDLTNLRVKINKLSVQGFANIGRFRLSVFRSIYDTEGNYISSGGQSIILEDEFNEISILNKDYDFIIDTVASGTSLILLFSCVGSATALVNFNASIDSFSVESVEILATSTAINSIIDGVPYFDFLKKGVKSISGLDFEANDIESGEFSGQYIFNGNLIRQKTDVPLNFVFKDEMNDLKEINADYQISDKVKIYQYPDFYKNIDLGVFLQTPDLKFERKFNDRFKKINLEYGYKTFEQDRNEENTIDAFHTEAQFLFPTTKVEDVLKIDISHIRDPFTIEAARKEAISSTTSLTTDDKIFIIDCVELPEGSMEEITRRLQMQALEPYNLKIRSFGFKWTLLGFTNGDTVNITAGENQGTYFILQHSDDILELVKSNLTLPNFSGTSVITLEYPLTDVSLVNRTNEGFDLIENIENPENVSNLKYTIKRNLSRTAWSTYLATISKDNFDEIIKCTDFKVNGLLTTQFQGGSVLTEKADFQINQLSEKILNKFEYKTNIMIGFEDAKNLIENVISQRGFIRIYDTQKKVVKVHPKLLDMNWATGQMEIIGESRNESDFILITSSEFGVNIEDVGFDDIIDTDLDWFKIINDYVQIFDNKQKPLINYTDFKKIKINGILYTDIIIFYETLNNL
jgi:hypothetical protein